MLGTPEILVILVAFGLLYGVGKFGQNTSLGFWGSVMLSIVLTPLIVFFIILIFLKQKRKA